jgi:hypothetical protein
VEVLDDPDSGAIIASEPTGSKPSSRFFRLDTLTRESSDRAFTVALFGDSITNFTSFYSYDCSVGAGYGTGYRMRARVRHPERYSVIHLNPGGTGSLSVSMTGTDLVVTLGRQDGVITSTVDQVRTAVLNSYGDYFMVNDYGDGGASLAQAADQKWFTPYSFTGPNSTFAWLQAKMGQRFDLARRVNYFSGPSTFQNEPEGDWDFGYPGQTALQLLSIPGPLGDVNLANASLVVGCAGANDILAGVPANEIKNRIVALWDTFVAGGRDLVWMEVPPSGTPALETVVENANALIRPIAASRNLTLLPWNPVFVSDGAASKEYFPDKIHPNDLACFSEADYIQPLIESHIQPVTPNYGNTANPAWLTANSAMSGNSSGLAGLWTNINPDQLTADKQASNDGGNDWQKVTIHQDRYGEFQLISPISNTGWSVGSKIEGVAEFECDTDNWDMRSLRISVRFVGNSSAEVTSMGVLQYGTVDFNIGKAGKFTLRTPPHNHSPRDHWCLSRCSRQRAKWNFQIPECRCQEIDSAIMPAMARDCKF